MCLVLRLPVGLASSLLSSAESRKTFLRLVQRLGPSSLTSEDQVHICVDVMSPFSHLCLLMTSFVMIISTVFIAYSSYFHLFG